MFSERNARVVNVEIDASVLGQYVEVPLAYQNRNFVLRCLCICIRRHRKATKKKQMNIKDQALTQHNT